MTFILFHTKYGWWCDPKGDGLVEGTKYGDLIDYNYTGDPEGDRIDHYDAKLSGEEKQDDIVLAGDGNDTVKAGEGNDEVFGGNGNDLLYGEIGNDELWGEAGNDTVYGGTGNDTLHGDGGSDSARESFNWSKLPDPNSYGDIDNGDSLSGKVLYQDTGAVTVKVTIPTNDTAKLESTFSTDKTNITGLQGDETINKYSTLKSYDTNGNGQATYKVEFDKAVTDVQFRVSDIDANKGQVTVKAWDIHGNPIEVKLDLAGSDLKLTDTDSVTGYDTATGIGTEANPTDAASNSMLVSIGGPVGRIEITHTNAGTGGSAIYVSDIFFNTPGTDYVGDDVLDGGDGDDLIDAGGGNDTVYGGTGNDTIKGGDGNDSVEGGDGDDVINTDKPGIQAPDRGYPGLFAGDTNPFDDRDTVHGGAGNDKIYTGDDNDKVYGGTGNDTIDSGQDDDYVEAGDGHDHVITGEGSDTVHGGAGNDTIWGGLGAGTDVLNIRDDQGDKVLDNGDDLIYGGDGDDWVNGQDDNDTIYGGTGNDTLDGDIDDDLIFGDEGADKIYGGQGNDTLTGGKDADQVFGGSDRDVFKGLTSGDNAVGGETGNDWDTLDLTGSGPLRINYTSTDPNNLAGTVEFLDDHGNVTGSATFSEMEEVIPCFTPGSMIATPKGERLVETLRVGDKVITRDNGIQEIRWIGQKALDWRALGSQPHLRPVLIRKGSLGHGLPERDMLVSPNHRVLVANDLTQLYFEEREVLVAAKHLVNNAGVSTADVLKVSYLHFMFDHHEVVLSDGAWTESFQPGDYTLKGIGNAQRAEILELFPELKVQTGLDGYAAARRTLKKHEAQMLMR